MNKTSFSKEITSDFTSNRFYVKYMVSLRCKVIVKSEMENLGLVCKFSPHGALEFNKEISDEEYGLLKKNEIWFCLVKAKVL